MPPADDGWIERVKVFAFLALYTTGLWGSAARALPAPLDGWRSLPYVILGSWWHRHVLTQLSLPEQSAAFELVAAGLLALVVPILALRTLGIGPRAAGLGGPGARGPLVTAAGVALTLPIGGWLAAVTPDPWGSGLQETLEFVSIVPEHFLIFGVFGVLLLPGRRLAWPETSGQGASKGVFAVAASVLVFWLVHVGTPHSAELWMSVPLGLVFAGMTVLTGSIWPSVVAHVTLNLLPMALMAWL